MFCKPPCPDEHDLLSAPECSVDRPAAKPAQALASHEALRRAVAPDPTIPPVALHAD